MNDDPSAVMGRLERLERENRRIKSAGVCALLAGAMFFLLGQAGPGNGVIEGKDFILRDANGRLRARLFIDEGTGGPSLKLYDEHPHPRMQQVRPLGGGDVNQDRFAVSRAVFGLLNNRPYLALSSPEGRQSATVSIQDYGPTILLSDENAKGGVEILFIKNRGPAVTLIDAEQNIRARLEVDKSEPFLKLWGTKGEVIFPNEKSGHANGEAATQGSE